MRNKNSRLDREYKTVAVMIAIYCRKHHLTDGLCTQCQELLDYACERLEKCPFGEDRTTCAKCPVHCFRLDMRRKIRAVMRYSGPRMIYRHPLMAFQHLLDGRREEPVRTVGK